MAHIVQPHATDGKRSGSLFVAPAAVGPNYPTLHVAPVVAQQFVNQQRDCA